MLFSVTIALAAVSIVFVLVRRHFRNHSVRQIRGPTSPSWIFGHEYAYTQQVEVGAWEADLLGEYGPTWRVRGLLGTDVLTTSDPKALQYIFQKSGYQYGKAESETRMLRIFAGPGIVTTSAVDHRRHRRMMNPAFNPTFLRTFLPLFQRVVGKLSAKWQSELASASALEIMVNKWLSVVTLDIIGEAAFGYDYGAVDGGMTSPIFKIYDNFFAHIELRPTKSKVFFRLLWDYVPSAILDWLRYIPLAPFSHLREIHDIYRRYGLDIIREKKAQLDSEDQKTSRDVMSLLIKGNASEDPKARLNDDELMAQMVTLTTAGHETTGSSLTFSLYELSRHPEYQQRMRAEIKDVRRRIIARGDSHFQPDDLESMLLVTNAIKETLRMHPIVPHLIRVASADDVLPLAYPIQSVSGEMITEIPIKAGQVIRCSLAGYNRLAGVWGADADEWNPDRFDRPDIAKGVTIGLYANLLSFSAGPRGCIGWRFSVLEMQALLAELVEQFEFAPPAENVEISRSPVSLVMAPTIKGKEELGIAMPLRVSLAQ